MTKHGASGRVARRAPLALAILIALAAATPSRAQDATPKAAPAPMETAPLAPPAGTGQPSPSAPSATGQAPVAPAPAAPAPATPAVPAAGLPSFKAYPTLVPPAANQADMDEVTLLAKPAISLMGESNWDNGFNALVAAFRKLSDEVTRAGLKPAGHPLTRFTETNDQTFKYEVLLPVDRTPDASTALSPGFKPTQTPAGKALRFVHKAPYDEIDATYEAITAYLDAKGIVVEDSFMEEYVSDLTNQADPELEINIYVTPK